MTITVKNETDLVVPPSVRRKAGIKAGDQLEIKASRGVITIVTKPGSAADEYTPEQRRLIDRIWRWRGRAATFQFIKDGNGVITHWFFKPKP